MLSKPYDEQQNLVFARGTEIGRLAQDLFPNGIDLSPPNPYSYQLSVEKTQKYLMTNDILYEAAFQFDGVLCAIDILIQRNGKWYGFEVKSTNSAKDQHIVDAALQFNIITKTGLPLEDISIIHFDRDYIRIGEIETRKLFTTTSILQEVVLQQSFIDLKLTECKQLIASKTEPAISIGEHCHKPYDCPFIDHCWKDEIAIPKPILSGEVIIDKEHLDQFFNGLDYPLYFFDFETVMYGVPEFDYSSPYQQIPFQYSLHSLQDENSTLKHTYFLGDGIHDPRPALIEKMINDLGESGSIITWNQTFEITCLRKLAQNFPNYATRINSIIERIVDLMIPFKSKWILIPACNGSASLKVVLPALLPELNYNSLEIQDGQSASFTYSLLKDMNEEDRIKHRNSLLAYCELDTLAMVKILEKIMTFIV
ncbi:MAG TPA: DUF2779 domain-containing protein [Chitinophagaceae bacterium]|nr:DUF2779 domain-containing protein [Chitinophagaceae bacterium]